MWLPSRNLAIVALTSLTLLGSPDARPRGLSGIFPGLFAPTGESCGAGKDLVVQALERLQADSSRSQLVDANELLKRASDLCSESGDAWYYRSLVEARSEE